MNTYQFKIFPVGVLQDKIITVDIKILRTSEYEGNKKLRLGLVNAKPGKIMWILYNYISIYDKKQNLISTLPIDTTHSVGTTYSDTLDSIYQRGLKKIGVRFVDIEYFKPYYISFCNFQQKCNLVRIKADTVLGNDFVIYEGKKYKIDIFKDTSYFGFGGSQYHSDRITELYINSIRIYKTKTTTLLVTHLATGDEISMGWITSDPKKVIKTKDEKISLAKEHKPNFVFADIKKSTYQEPLLHHGYGFDIFIIK